MLPALSGVVAFARRLWRVVVVFAVLRIAFGAAALVLFDRDALAWGPELTAIVCAAMIIYLAAAIVMRGTGARAVARQRPRYTVEE